MKRFLKILFRTEGTRPWLVLFCLVLAGLAEAASIGTLLPVAASVAGGEAGKSSAVGQYVNSFMGWLGIAPTLGNLVLLVVVLMVLKSAMAFVALSYAGISSARVSILLRQRLIAAIFRARWSYFADQSGGRFANALSNDATRAGDAYLSAAQILAFALQAAGYVTVATIINPKLALLGLGAALIVAFALQYLVRSAKRAGYKQTDRTASLTVHMVDMLSNIKPLKTMERHQSMLGSIARMLGKLKNAMVSRELSRAGLAHGGDALIAVLAGLGIYFASAKGDVSLPELIVSGVIFLQVVSLASKLQKQIQLFVLYESAYVRVEELIDVAEANREAHTGTQKPLSNVTLKFDDVSFSHGDKKVLTNVSFEIEPKAITVLSGPSGSGKTTIVDLLIGLNRPNQGRILIGKTPLDEIAMSAWRSTIGYVPQELGLFHTNVRDNITLGNEDISDTKVMEAISLAGASPFIESLPQGLDTDVGEMGSKFSGGQRQRISLARALVTEPAILILDEVTSALDPATEAEIVENITELRGRYTIVVITHRPAWTRIADRLYKVSHGKVIPVASLRKTSKPRKK
jgi:ATP-binding cassette subfamily C protein